MTESEQPKKRKYYPRKSGAFKSFNMNALDLEMLDYLIEKWGCNASATMRRALTDAYSKCMYDDTRK